MRLIVVLALSVAFGAAAATPQQGVPVQIRRGFFTEADIGAFFTVGGNAGISNLQTYLQLGIGYDIGQHVELAAHFGLGTSAANCFSGTAIGGGCTFADTFTVSFIDLTGTYLVQLIPQLYLTPRIAVGYSALDPNPVFSHNGRSFTPAANMGVGIGIEYATSQEHFSVGAEIVYREVFGGANIATFSIVPRLKYTF